tara:strand:- start:287 stop:886 length:600 start_codon:yes stop_codon:yes gene_type:complete
MNQKKPLNIYQRILSVMDDLHFVQKEDKRVNGQYTFVSHDAVSAAIHPLLVKHRIVVTPTVIDHTIDGNRTVVNVEVNFVNADMPEEKITINSIGYGIDNQDKGIGKAVSYATKYAFLKMFVLETGDDPEQDLIEHQPDTITNKQAVALQNLIEETGTRISDFCAHFEISELKNLPKTEFKTAATSLQKKQEKLHAISQ